MYIDDAVNSHNIKSKKPLDIEAFGETFADKKDVITNLDFKVKKIESLQPRQIGIEK